MRAHVRVLVRARPGVHAVEGLHGRWLIFACDCGQVKKSFVGKFNKVKDEHKRHVHEEYKKSASRKSLHGKKNKLADELTSSGHKASPPPEDEAVKFMALLPWILPVVCLSILVIVGVGARMCQAGNYKHTEALREGGVQPSFKYGGPIGRSM